MSRYDEEAKYDRPKRRTRPRTKDRPSYDDAVIGFVTTRTAAATPVGSTTAR